MKINNSNIKKAKKFLDNYECVAIPTETVYGLAANAYSDKATKKIFKLKKRPKSNPLIVHYRNLIDLKKDCLINKEFLKLYKKFCPGPLTFILPLKKKSKISKNVTNNKKNLAVRFPKHKIMRVLLKKVNYPLAAPSANLSTRVSAVNPNDVKDDFGKKIKYILNGGPSSIGVESTIIDIVKNPKIQRTLKKRIRIENNPKKISAPGQYKLHYSPGIPIKLNVKKSNNYQAFLLIKKQKDDQPNYYYLTKTRNLNEAARNLYSTLRQIKKDKFKYIVVQKIPSIGLGKTINDRLLRASKF